MRRKFLAIVYHLLLHGALLELGPSRKRARHTSGCDSDDHLTLDKIIDDLLLLSTISTPLPIQQTHGLSLRNMSDDQCWNMCRFTRPHLYELANLLAIPEYIVTQHGSVCHREIALPMFLFRLAHAHTWWNIERDFTPRQSSARAICTWLLDHIWQRFHHLLTGPNCFTTREELLRSALAISKKLGLSLPVVMGFIDGKLFATCRPSVAQESIFNGKDRVHGLKYQGVLHACGLLMNFAGPEAGRRHDAYVWMESQFAALLNEVLHGIALALFGDSAYPRSSRMLKPFVGRTLTDEQRAFNDRWCSGMSCTSSETNLVVRVSVEWTFAEIVSLWKLVDDTKQMKVLLSPVSHWIEVAALLTNVHNCYYPNIVSQYFECPPPTAAQYLQV